MILHNTEQKVNFSMNNHQNIYVYFALFFICFDYLAADMNLVWIDLKACGLVKVFILQRLIVFFAWQSFAL